MVRVGEGGRACARGVTMLLRAAAGVPGRREQRTRGALQPDAAGVQ